MIKEYIAKVYGERNLEERDYRLKASLRPEKNQIEYSYIESEETRNKADDNEHFSLALQGGGVKGV